MKTVLKGENWTSGTDGTVETYTDNEGRTVLERRIHTDTKGTEHLDTYYVYDDLNRLRYVLPPQAEEIFRQAGETRSESDKGIADYAYAYRYNGNQLTKVTDNAASSAYSNGFEFKDGADRETEYTYDENGNLTQDLNRNIKDIQYNFLNLPQRIDFGDGSTTEYLYDAEGRKLRTVHRADGKTTTTDYAGNLIYENGNPSDWLRNTDMYLCPKVCTTTTCRIIRETTAWWQIGTERWKR